MTDAGQLSAVASPAKLALDVHGGDFGLAVTLPAAVLALQSDPLLEIILVGQKDAIESHLGAGWRDRGKRLRIAHAADILLADAKPSEVLRRGRDSSLWQALQLVASGQADACVSGGSTAALVTAGVKLIGMLPGIYRPALMACMPNAVGVTAILDLGANVDVSARQLVQFAVMGSVTAEVADGVTRPRVGLLNVGHEDSKGHGVVREAHNELKLLPLNYQGFIEGNDLFTGKVDVAVCDGFAGNLLLKSSEGLARMLLGEFRSALGATLLSRLGAVLAGPSLRRVLAPLDPSTHNGAPLLGLNAVVLKSHGGADVKAMSGAILKAGREARRRVPEKIAASIRSFQVEKES